MLMAGAVKKEVKRKVSGELQESLKGREGYGVLGLRLLCLVSFFLCSSAITRTSDFWELINHFFYGDRPYEWSTASALVFFYFFATIASAYGFLYLGWAARFKRNSKKLEWVKEGGRSFLTMLAIYLVITSLLIGLHRLILVAYQEQGRSCLEELFSEQGRFPCLRKVLCTSLMLIPVYMNFYYPLCQWIHPSFSPFRVLSVQHALEQANPVLTYWKCLGFTLSICGQAVMQRFSMHLESHWILSLLNLLLPTLMFGSFSFGLKQASLLYEQHHDFENHRKETEGPSMKEKESV